MAGAGLFLELRRPADVLVHLARDPDAPRAAFDPVRQVALDVKVISAVGRSHARVGDMPAPFDAMDAYARVASAREQTAVLCRANRVEYLPIVFTAQGGPQQARRQCH